MITTQQMDMLDEIADRIEEILRLCGLPATVDGGYITNPSLKLQLRWRGKFDPWQHQNRCAELTQALQQEFGAEIAGIDADDTKFLHLVFGFERREQ